MKSYLKIPDNVLNAMKINENLNRDKLIEETAAQLIYLSGKSSLEGSSTISLECPDESNWNSMYGSDCLMKSVLKERNILV